MRSRREACPPPYRKSHAVSKGWMQSWERALTISTVSDRFRPSYRSAPAGNGQLPGFRDAGGEGTMDEAAAPPREDPTTWLEPIATSLATPTWRSRPNGG